MTSLAVCTGVLDVSGAYPACSVPWVQVQTDFLFDPSTLDPLAVFSAIGSGFILAAVPLAVIWGGRVLVSMFFTNGN